jgi:hypothetical protein
MLRAAGSNHPASGGIMAGGSKLGRKREAVIAALLSEPSQEAAARKAGVGEATVARWLRDPFFQAAYRQARRAVLEQAVGRLQQLCGEAADALKRNLTCGQPASEVRAAVAVLEQAGKGLEALDLLDEVAELRRQLGGGEA